MLIKIEKPDGKTISVNVNHIIEVSEDVYNQSKITLINGAEINCKQSRENLHVDIKSVFAKFMNAR